MVKLPAKWAMTHEATDAVTQTIDDFLRSTNRVVAVLQFYARHALRGGSVETDYQINEVISHSHRFGGSPEDWMILRHQPVRPFGWMSIHNVIKQVAGELATTPHGP